MPIGYISSYVDADDASHAAEARVKYLNRIYDILDCDNPNSTGNMRTTSSYQQLGTVVNPHYAPVHSSQDYYHETEPTNGEWHY